MPEGQRALNEPGPASSLTVSGAGLVQRDASQSWLQSGLGENWLFLINLFMSMGMAFLPACMSEHNVCVWCCWEPEEGVGSPQTGVNDSCEMSCGCLESNQGPPEEHPVFLTAEPLLQAGQLRFRSVLKTGAHITEA